MERSQKRNQQKELSSPLQRKRNLLYQSWENIGFEQNGKGEYFLRPVLVLRKFSKYFFVGIPLTLQAKEDMFHFKFSFRNNKRSYAILSQIRAFEALVLRIKRVIQHMLEIYNFIILQKGKLCKNR